MIETIRQDIADIIGIDINSIKSSVSYTVLETVQEDGYIRKKIEYESFGDMVPAYLLIPERVENAPAVLINHQHNGHSMGGNTVQFLSALDERISFACSSGSACSYKNRMANGVGIELASVVPNLYKEYDIGDLLACVAPRKLLIVSADDDKYSRDAADVVDVAKRSYAELNVEDNIVHIRYKGGHALTQERFDAIVKWILSV